MRYIVTGGGGFIGSHLSEELVNRGHRVKIIENFIQGQRHRIPRDCELIEEDICDYEKIAQYFDGIDGVFHLAAYPRVPRSIKEPVLSHHININGTFNVLEASAKAGVRRLIFSSSSTPYGEQDTLPLNEDMKVKPMCPYAAQKISGEMYCDIYSQLYNIETVVLRYFGVYGTHMLMNDEYAMAIPAFIKCRMEGRKAILYGDGSVTRDFTHVSDVVRANILAMESSNVGKAEIINIGGGNNISVFELLKSIGTEYEKKPARYEPKNTLADNSKARELLGWEPTVAFQDGIAELLDFYFPKSEHKYEKEIVNS